MAVISNFVYVNENGFHYPDYETILNLLKQEYMNIYGSDVYLGNDSQDGQWIAIQALAMYELAEVAANIYASFSPATASKDALTRNVKINGIRRKGATYSTVDLLVTGEVGTVIQNGIVKDKDGQKWLLPDKVTIGTSGQVTVQGQAKEIGAVKAPKNTITKIVTAQRGWQSVTNDTDAVVGKDAETDFELRLRQSRSVAIPSQTVLEGITGSLYSLDGVEKLKLVENSTSITDENGVPPHSICLVIKGGDTAAIAKVLAVKKTIGAGTYGDLVSTHTDRYGLETKCSFFRPNDVRITAKIIIKPLTGYTNNLADTIKQKVSDYINSVNIGGVIYLSKLYTPANLSNGDDSNTFDVISIALGRGDAEPKSSNIQLGFKELAVCTAGDVTVELETGD